MSAVENENFAKNGWAKTNSLLHLLLKLIGTAKTGDCRVLNPRGFPAHLFRATGDEIRDVLCKHGSLLCKRSGNSPYLNA